MIRSDLHAPLTLSASGCRNRQASLRDALQRLGANAGLIVDPGHLSYFFGYHQRTIFPAAGIVFANGPAIICQAEILPVEATADETQTYRANILSTQVDNLAARVDALVAARLKGIERIACDSSVGRGVLERPCFDLYPSILSMRRHKGVDEIALLVRAIEATEAGYAAIEARLEPGLTEIELFALFHQAAVVNAGEAIGELGNNFRGGTLEGGSPRPVPLKAGDLIPLDAGAVLRGYNADLCRTYAVSGELSDVQRLAIDAVAGALIHAEGQIAPGVSCKDVFAEIHARLDGQRGFKFHHHLGHGIGLAPHEAPRVNPHWDDVFEVGDVFTLEPGLYGHELRPGVRIEHVYLVTDSGLVRLSNPWPAALADASVLPMSAFSTRGEVK
jgi:Xaa-Pro dipeptidase